jgi:hypothetical protein
MEYHPKNSFSMSCASRMVIFPGVLSNALIFKLTGALDYMLSIALNGTLQMHSTSSSITYYTVANRFLATSILYLQDSRLSISSRYLWRNPWYGDREARTAAPVFLSAPASRRAFKISAGRPGLVYIFMAAYLTASLHIYKACLYRGLHKTWWPTGPGL